MAKVNVLISGAGPVGLTMANELVRHGISVRIVDKSAERTDKSKALVLWSRTLELFDHAGYVDSVPGGGPAGAWRADVNGKEVIARISLDRHRQPLSLRADDPAERHRACPRGAAGEARREGRAHRRAGELHRSGQPGRGRAAQGERRERDARGGLADRLRRRPFDRAARAGLHLRRHDAGQRLVSGGRPYHRARAAGPAAHLLAQGRHPGLLPDHGGTLAGHRRSRPGRGRRPCPIRPWRRSRR